MDKPRVKVVVIGNGGVGKTSMLITYLFGKFPSVYIPTSIEDGPFDYMVDGQAIIAGFWDTAGGEDYPRLRPLSYPQTDVFYLCFDIGDRETFDCIPGEWIPEVRNVCPDVPIMLVGCKKDLRDSTPATCVPLEEAEAKAVEWGMAAYFETSALFNVGLVAAFKQCLRIGYHHCMVQQRDLRPLNRLRKRFKVHKRQPPVMPLQVPIPSIEPDSSSFADDWLAAFKSQEHADVIFVLASGSEMRAHKIVLCAASSFLDEVINSKHCSRECSDAPSVGISNIQERRCENGHMIHTIVLETDIEDHTLRQCLQFLYSGLPSVSPDEEPANVAKLMTLSQLWELQLLESICINIEKEESHLNPSIAVSHNTAMGEKLAKEFLLANKWTDVSFDVEGRHISAHRLVLCTRCRVFATMLSDRFKEGAVSNSSICIPNTSHGTFKSLLEYLYSDHTSIEDGDPVGILVLANQFCQSRLVQLAEYYITKGIENSFKTKSEDVDVVSILYSAKDHNAKQLPEWCLRFIAKNYEKFKSRPEFKGLTDDHRAFVEEHQWPPLSYIRELEQYRAAQRRKCAVM